ncbi:MAG TPA: hypothetical protein VD833_11560 [Vicinamibacterales bacterium]|nr:hypothetical protein [Vicinamibacterales bacterium]
MRLRRLPCLFVVVIALITPPDAAADRLGFWRWWDGLSGPGPFYGWDYELPLQTWGTKRDAPTTGRTVFFDPSGLEHDPNRLHLTAGFEVAVMWTDRSDLQYPAGVSPPKVYAFPVTGTVDVGIRGVLGGVGVGAVKLSGPQTGQWHGLFEPRLTIRPFVVAAGERAQRWHELLQARVYFSRVGGIVPSDFGAIGDAEEDAEWVPGVTLSVNVLAISWIGR